MSALPVQDIFEVLHDAGLNVSLMPGGDLGISPASRLTGELRDLIRGNKAVLVNWMQALSEKHVFLEAPADPKAWRELAHEYHQHHFACNTCIAAGHGSRYGLRCCVGAALWNAYQTEGKK